MLCKQARTGFAATLKVKNGRGGLTPRMNPTVGQLIIVPLSNNLSMTGSGTSFATVVTVTVSSRDRCGLIPPIYEKLQ
ncbi:hypothetical protein D3C78_1783720 [compost metagenome]